ncbi:hypothetical protein [Terrimonas alba]|uniref:hypothetical protein n=1 Tax=Terrimonas alba TaxID=3349636 RepID=UPI0035F22DCB
MAFPDKILKEEKLNELSFLDCVKWLRDTSERLSYYKGSNNEYWEAREIIQYLIKRYCKEYGFTSDNYKENEIGGLLFSTNFELDDYNKYDKAQTIAEFKADMEENTSRLIYQIENK